MTSGAAPRPTKEILKTLRINATVLEHGGREAQTTTIHVTGAELLELEEVVHYHLRELINRLSPQLHRGQLVPNGLLLLVRVGACGCVWVRVGACGCVWVVN